MGKPRGSEAMRKLQARVAAQLKRQKRVGGRPAAVAVTKAIDRVARRYEALALRRKRMSWRQIGEALDPPCCYIEARRLVYEAAGEIEEDTPRMAGLLRTVEGESLDEVQRAMLPLAHGALGPKTQVVTVRGSKGGKPEVVTVQVPLDPVEVARVQAMAVQRIVNISARRSALFGLDAPIKVTPTDPTGTRRYHDLTDEELERMLTQKAALVGLPGLPAAIGSTNGHGPHDDE